MTYNLTFYLKRGDIGRAARESGYQWGMLRNLLEGKGSKTYPSRKLIAAIAVLGQASVENLKTTPIEQLNKYEMHLHDSWQVAYRTQMAIAEQLAQATATNEAQATVGPVAPLSEFVEQSPFLSRVEQAPVAATA